MPEFRMIILLLETAVNHFIKNLLFIHKSNEFMVGISVSYIMLNCSYW